MITNLIQINSTTQLKLTPSTLEINSGEKKLTIFRKPNDDGNLDNLKDTTLKVGSINYNSLVQKVN